jgi:hypothetical protein
VTRRASEIESWADDLLAEAMGYSDENADEGETDEELDAQIDMLRDALARGDSDEIASRARHLEGQLLTGYADPEDLPDQPFQAGAK